MWIRSELKERGKINFKRFYWKSVLVCFITLLLGGGINSSVGNNTYNSTINNNYSYEENYDDEYFDDEYYDEGFVSNIFEGTESFFSDGFFFMFTGIAIVFAILGFIIKLLIVYPLEIGKNNFFMGIRENKKL